MELSGKLHLLWGNLGAGLKQFQQVQEICIIMRSQRAILRSNLNLAHIFILLNQTSTAQQYLVDTQSNALKIGDKALAARAELLLQLANARSRSLVTASPVGMSVGDMSNKLHPQTQLGKKLPITSQTFYNCRKYSMAYPNIFKH